MLARGMGIPNILMIWIKGDVMNKAKKYIIKFAGQTYVAENKPKLNETLRKLTSMIGRELTKTVNFEITVEK